MVLSTLIESFQSRGFGFQVNGDKLVVSPSSQLTDADREIIRAHKADLVAALNPEPGTRAQCDRCGTPVRSEAGEGRLHTWCPEGCFDQWTGKKPREAAGSLDPAPPRALHREELEARKLFEDLRAAGCGISWDGEELRITNLAKLPTALWLRLENADTDFLRLAREIAETLENQEARPWVN